jgi:hypothetical protein
VAEEGVPIRDIMAVVVNHLKLPLENKPWNKVVEILGFTAHVVNADNLTLSEKTQKELGYHSSPTPSGHGSELLLVEYEFQLQMKEKF